MCIYVAYVQVDSVHNLICTFKLKLFSTLDFFSLRKQLFQCPRSSPLGMFSEERGEMAVCAGYSFFFKLKESFTYLNAVFYLVSGECQVGH